MSTSPMYYIMRLSAPDQTVQLPEYWSKDGWTIEWSERLLYHSSEIDKHVTERASVGWIVSSEPETGKPPAPRPAPWSQPHPATGERIRITDFTVFDEMPTLKSLPEIQFDPKNRYTEPVIKTYDQHEIIISPEGVKNLIIADVRSKYQNAFTCTIDVAFEADGTANVLFTREVKTDDL